MVGQNNHAVAFAFQAIQRRLGIREQMIGTAVGLDMMDLAGDPTRLIFIEAQRKRHPHQVRLQKGPPGLRIR